VGEAAVTAGGQRQQRRVPLQCAVRLPVVFPMQSSRPGSLQGLVARPITAANHMRTHLCLASPRRRAQQALSPLHRARLWVVC
jgi:hypothetical protein